MNRTDRLYALVRATGRHKAEETVASGLPNNIVRSSRDLLARSGGTERQRLLAARLTINHASPKRNADLARRQQAGMAASAKPTRPGGRLFAA
jgi:hypothetical protein